MGGSFVKSLEKGLLFSETVRLPWGNIKIKIGKNKILELVSDMLQHRQYIIEYLKSRLWNNDGNHQQNCIEMETCTTENFIRVGTWQEEPVIETFLNIAGLLEKKDSLVEGLNDYEKTKLNLLRQVLLNRRVILLQDPFEKLTMEEKEELKNIMIEFSLWNTIIVTGTLDEQIDDLFDQIIGIDKETENEE